MWSGLVLEIPGKKIPVLSPQTVADLEGAEPAYTGHWRRQQWGTGARPPGLDLAHTHQFGNLYLHIGRPVVNFCDFCLISPCPLSQNPNNAIDTLALILPQ